MNRFNTEGSNPWDVDSSSDSTGSQTGGLIEQKGEENNTGSSMNAISIGFVATAILISMFLIMAVFEHLFKPNSDSVSSTQDTAGFDSTEESRPHQKLVNPPPVPTRYSSDFSVLMPGQRYPTYIAQAAPLPCPREGAYWPSHEHNFVYP